MTSGLPTLGLARLRDLVSEPDARRHIERDALPGFLGRQRWFGSKARPIERVRLGEIGELPGRDGAVLAFADVGYADGSSERYTLPLTAVEGDRAQRIVGRAPQAALARLGDSPGPIVVDGMADDDFCRDLLAMIETARTAELGSGRLVGMRDENLPADGTLEVRRTGAEQSNTSVIFGGHGILKLLRRVEPGAHPEIEIGRQLRTAGFDAAPRLLGTLEYRRQDAATAVGILHALVPNQGDGWEHALREAAAFFARVGDPARGPEPALPPGGLLAAAGAVLPGDLQPLFGGYTGTAAVLGRQTAEMHLALARAAGDPAFEPEALDQGDARRVANDTRTRAHRVWPLLADRLPALPAEARAPVGELVGAKSALFTSLDALSRLPVEGQRTRVHQDYHLGQLLWTGREYVILDFEGEPARPLSERRVKRSPLTDVAGMLRSYSYAAWSALFAATPQPDTGRRALEPFAVAWESWVSGAFLRAYRDAAGGAAFLPRTPALLEAWLRALMVEKAVYELEYELNNRPGWVRVPAEGLLRLLAASESLP